MNKIKAMLKEAAARQEIHDVDKNYIWSTIFAAIALITLIVIRIKGFSVGRVVFESVMLLVSLVFVGKAKDKSQDADTIVNYNKNN